jgi:hypothetical protein
MLMGRSGTMKLGMELMNAAEASKADKPRCCMACAVTSSGHLVSKVPLMTRH